MNTPMNLTDEQRAINAEHAHRLRRRQKDMIILAAVEDFYGNAGLEGELADRLIKEIQQELSYVRR